MKNATIALTLLVSLFASNSYAVDVNQSTNIDTSMRSCVNDADCMVVDTDCSDCCNYSAVAKNQRTLFETHKQKQCGKPSILCDCSPDYATLEQMGKLPKSSKGLGRYEGYEKLSVKCVNQQCTYKDPLKP